MGFFKSIWLHNDIVEAIEARQHQQQSWDCEGAWTLTLNGLIHTAGKKVAAAIIVELLVLATQM